MTSHLPLHMPADGEPGVLTQEDREALVRSALFAGCADVPWPSIHAFARVRHVPHGAFLLQPGEPHDAVYVLVEGQLAAFGDAAMTRLLGRFVPADCVGEYALVGPDAGNAYVAAQWPARLISLDAHLLRRAMDTMPRLALNVLDIFGERWRAARAEADRYAGQDSVDFMVTHDAVTGLHNRRWMSAAYASEIVRAAGEGRPLCLALLDVDHFDKMNQALGRAAGDAILRQLADSIRNAMPSLDMLVRMAGDRFAALIPGSLPEVAQSCDRLRSQIAGRQIALRGHMASQVTVSIGVAQAATDLDEVLNEAAAALARAKERGRNTVEPPPA